MAKAYTRLWNHVAGWVPAVGPTQSQEFVKRAWEVILESKDVWSFLTKETFLTVPDAVTAGTVSVVQDSTAVTADATAKTALDLVGQTALKLRQFVAGQGPFYDISAYDNGTGVITLDRNYYEETNASAAYAVTAAYFTVPADFRNWITVVDKVEDFQLDIAATREELDERDPQRSITDSPRSLVSLDYALNTVTDTFLPRYEFYPFPQVRRQYPSLYMQKPSTLSDKQPLPGVIPERLVQIGALMLAAEWGEANRERKESLAGADWRYLRDKWGSDYDALLATAKRNDRNIYSSSFATNYLNPPLYGRGARYLQSHAPYPAG